MALALLDGEYVAAEGIRPSLHKYLGMFRPAMNPLIPEVPAIVLCPCGHTLHYQEQSRQHYAQGCCDIPQYTSIAK